MIDVRDVPERSRYEVSVDGQLAGHANYRDQGEVRVFVHTEVDDAFEGQGVGSTLAQAALDDVRASGRTLVAQCPFIRSYIERHPEYADLVSSPGSRPRG
jgi:predicted GNAT family acetyltransferase